MNKLFALILAILVAVGLLSSTMFVVDQRQYAIIFAFGEVKDVLKEPGLHFKLPPPLQNVLFLERRIMTIDTPTVDRIITAEKKNLLVDAYIKWRITDPRQFYISFRSGDERVAQDRISQWVVSAINEAFTKRTVRDLVSAQRDTAMQEIRGLVAEEAKRNGLEVVDVRLKRVDFQAEISDSVFRRMEAERKRVANELRSTGQAESEKIRADAERQRDIILAEAYRDAQRIKGAGDAKSSAVYAEAFGRDPQFAQFWRSLEAYRASFKDKKDLMVLDPSTDFFKFMRGSGGAPAAPKK
ncbi:MAG: protease modulator HflC [Candidatus Protistobacter heckmanni]|nr:protease modulator HflC [Candidatus Protistobacter heckmanni]